MSTASENHLHADDAEIAAILARIDRLPFTRWHSRALGIVGTAHFFDAFDALTIAFVLPLLVMQWHLTHAQTGLTISAGYVGQMIGAIAMGHAAERFGRIRVLRWALFAIAILSFASAFAWGLGVFTVLRFVQGIGLGGESPVAATYINEIAPPSARGRVVFVLQSAFALGVLITAAVAVWMIPRFGWQVMFFIGALPIILAVLLPRLLAESPRWLAERGRVAEAAAIVADLERRVVDSGGSLSAPHAAVLKPRPPRTTPADLLRGGYAGRSVMLWFMALTASVVGYGMSTWMPTVYMTVYKLPLTQALHYALATNVAAFLGAVIAINVIDRLGRRWNFLIGFVGACLPLLALWYIGVGGAAFTVMIMAAISFAFLNFVLCGVYVYAPELYPTRMRATGAGAASAWLRIGSIVGPLVVGYLLPSLGITRVFLFFGVVAVLGAVTMLLFGPETRGRKFHEIEL